jgi:hypothetical protein
MDRWFAANLTKGKAVFIPCSKLFLIGVQQEILMNRSVTVSSI